jgi:hypothetical protein
MKQKLVTFAEVQHLTDRQKFCLRVSTNVLI